jgi:hypothetical protein
MLWGATIGVYMDHNKLICAIFGSQHVLSWSMLVEDFKPKVFYKPGIHNIEANFFTPYPILACRKENRTYAQVSHQCSCFPIGLDHHKPSGTRPRTIHVPRQALIYSNQILNIHKLQGSRFELEPKLHGNLLTIPKQILQQVSRCPSCYHLWHRFWTTTNDLTTYFSSHCC